METVVGVLQDRAEATRLIHDLNQEGVTPEQVSIVTSELPQMRGEEATSRTLIGAEAGAGLGALGGLALSGIAMTVPGIGPILALGPIAGMLGGAGLGAIGGGLAGAFADLGAEIDDVHLYEEAVRQGGAVVAVRVERAQEQKITDLFLQHHAVDVVHRGGKWHAH